MTVSETGTGDPTTAGPTAVRVAGGVAVIPGESSGEVVDISCFALPAPLGATGRRA
jgi:hypothetical protein